jgi:RNA polymerase sigma-70 factor (ECF subfamily)
VLAGETRRIVEQAIEALPPAQRAVISLRDVEGWSSGETCNALGLTETNQRVLLHRARSKVRRALEDYLSEDL